MNDSKTERATLDQVDLLLKCYLGVQDGEESQSALPKCVEDVVVLTLHAAMIAYGFRLIECNNQSLGSSTSSGREALPEAWNREAPDRYALRYNHPHAEGSTLFRLGQIEELLSIQCRPATGGPLINLEVNQADFIAISTFPLQATSLNTVFQQHGLRRLLKVLREGFINRIVPERQGSGVNLQEGRYVSDEKLEMPLTQAPSLRESMPSLPRVQAPSQPPGQFLPPDFEDEHQVYDRPTTTGGDQGRSIFSIGHDDLNPPGLGNPSLTGPFFGGPGVGDGGMHGGGGSGGMYPSPDHPMFGRRRDPNSDGRRGPPGSRWDPTGPPGPSFGGGFGGGGGFGSGGGGIL